MVHLYLSDSAAKVGFSDNRITVVGGEGGDRSFPVETVDAVVVFGQPFMSAKLLQELLKREIDLQLFSSDGHYFGRLSPPGKPDAARLRLQVVRSNREDFSLDLSKQILGSKLRNQLGLLESYDHADADLTAARRTINHSLTRLGSAGSIEEALGLEGLAAKSYFAALADLVPPAFRFAGRTTRPPRDPFNAMISLGYSLLYKVMIGVIERHGLSPVVGFMHKDAPQHASLASDLVEPWRAPIVDDTVLQILWSDRVSPADFATTSNGGVYGTSTVTRALSKAFGDKLARGAPYLEQDGHRYTFEYASELQVLSLLRAIEADDPAQYIAAAVLGGDIGKESDGDCPSVP